MLVVSHTGDPHIPLVTSHLAELGCAFHVLRTDEIGRSVHLRYATDGRRAAASLAGQDGPIDLADVTAVWNRRIFVNPGGTEPAVGDPLRAQYVREQRRALLDGALATIEGHWVNAVGALTRARSKLGQLAVAPACGLAVPPTLADADADEVRRFARQHADTGVVTKVVTPGTPIVADRDHQYMVFTQEFDPAVGDAAITAAPALYQVQVEKDFEVRAVVVGSRVLACRIDSQATETTRIDWRRDADGNVAHRPVDVPESVRAGLLAMTRRYGLRFAAADMIVTPDGSWVFLELNPNGQWAWLEETTGVPIGRALAEELARPGDRRG